MASAAQAGFDVDTTDRQVSLPSEKMRRTEATNSLNMMAEDLQMLHDFPDYAFTPSWASLSD
jgi:hypothetical protein